MGEELARIREAERKSHIKMYTDGASSTASWLRRPVKVLQDVLPHLDCTSKLRILDLGCGIGRNSIFLAEKLKANGCEIECIDLLDEAIEQLRRRAREYDVDDNIYGTAQAIESFRIIPEKYDLILAVSALEHVESERLFFRKILEIRNGLRKGGIACLILNSDVEEFDLKTDKTQEAQFEIQLAAKEILLFLDEVFSGWKILWRTVKKQEFEVPRDSGTNLLRTNVVTFVVQNNVE